MVTHPAPRRAVLPHAGEEAASAGAAGAGPLSAARAFCWVALLSPGPLSHSAILREFKIILENRSCTAGPPPGGGSDPLAPMQRKGPREESWLGKSSEGSPNPAGGLPPISLLSLWCWRAQPRFRCQSPCDSLGGVAGNEGTAGTAEARIPPGFGGSRRINACSGKPSTSRLVSSKASTRNDSLLGIRQTRTRQLIKALCCFFFFYIRKATEKPEQTRNWSRKNELWSGKKTQQSSPTSLAKEKTR